MNKIPDVIQSGFDLILTAPAKRRLSLEDIAEHFAEEMDAKILDKERAGVKFVTGEFRISSINGFAVQPSASMYFALPDKQSLLLDYEGDVFTLSRLNLAAIMELKDKKTVAFEITAPQIF